MKFLFHLSNNCLSKLHRFRTLSRILKYETIHFRINKSNSLKCTNLKIEKKIADLQLKLRKNFSVLIKNATKFMDLMFR